MQPVRASSLLLALALAACGGAASPSLAPVAPSATSAAAGAAVASASASGASARPASASPPAASAAAKPATSAGASGAAAAKPKIHSAWVALTAGQAPSWTANDGGYFTRQGLDVELTYIEGSAKAAAAMIGGSVENGEMAAEGTIQAIVKGGDLVIIAGFNNYSPFKLVVDPSKVKAIADLKGKTIATTQGGSADEFTLYKVLSLNGLGRQDVNVTYMTGGDPARLAALQAHRIDASMVSADFGRAAVKQGDVILVDTIPLKIPEPQNTLVTTRAYLSGHRPELLSFLKAEAQGIHRYKADKPFAQQVMGKYLKTTDQDLLDGSYEAYSQLIPDDMKVLPESIQTVLDQDKITGHKPTDFFDMSLVDQLTTSGFLKSLTS